MRAAIEVDEGDVAEGSMDLLNVAQVARSALKVDEKLKNALMELVSLPFRQAYPLLGNIPEKAKSVYRTQSSYPDAQVLPVSSDLI